MGEITACFAVDEKDSTVRGKRRSRREWEGFWRDVSAGVKADEENVQREG